MSRSYEQTLKDRIVYANYPIWKMKRVGRWILKPIQQNSDDGSGSVIGVEVSWRRENDRDWIMKWYLDGYLFVRDRYIGFFRSYYVQQDIKNLIREHYDLIRETSNPNATRYQESIRSEISIYRRKPLDMDMRMVAMPTEDFSEYLIDKYVRRA